MIKEAKTIYPVNELISERWSPRAFSNKSISTEEISTILEAASWAASAMNEQPWRYRFALKGTPGFETMLSCILPGNQLWAKEAAALILSSGNKTFNGNGQLNKSFLHDCGMANANLITQALSMDIYTHIMGGFDSVKTISTFQLEESEEPICFIALGYLGSPETLSEPFKTREIAPRTRKPLEEFTFDNSFIY